MGSVDPVTEIVFNYIKDVIPVETVNSTVKQCISPPREYLYVQRNEGKSRARKEKKQTNRKETIEKKQTQHTKVEISTYMYIAVVNQLKYFYCTMLSCSCLFGL